MYFMILTTIKFEGYIVNNHGKVPNQVAIALSPHRMSL